jgi:tight adherence protein B
MSGAAGVLAALVSAVAAAAAVYVAAVAVRTLTIRHEDRLARLTRVDLAELFIFIEPGQFVRLNIALLLAVPLAIYAASGSALLAAAFVALLLFGPGLVYRHLRARRRRTLLRQLPDAAAAIAAALRAGLGLWQALEQVPRLQPRPIGQEFALMLRQQRMGVPLEDALRGLSTRSRLHDFQMFVATLQIARDLGGGLAEALERLASAVRRRAVLEDRISALTAQGRMQGMVVAALPIFIGLALLALDPGSMSRLLLTPLGWLTLAIIAMLELTGWWLIRRIMRIDL